MSPARTLPILVFPDRQVHIQTGEIGPGAPMPAICEWMRDYVRGFLRGCRASLLRGERQDFKSVSLGGVGRRGQDAPSTSSGQALTTAGGTPALQSFALEDAL